MTPVRGSRAAAIGLALACATVFAFVTDAFAHGALKSSQPAAGAHLERFPREIRLTFNEAAERAFTRITLLSADGRTVALGPLTIRTDSAAVVSTPITGAIGPGVYTVQWQMAGRDAHPVRGSFTFTIVPGAIADTAPSPATTPHHPPAAIPDNPDPGTFDAESPIYAAIRWLGFIAAFLVLGAVAFRYAVVGRMGRAAGPAGLALVEPVLARAADVAVASAVGLLVITTVRLAAQTVAMHGAAAALDPAAIGSMLIGTLWGKAWLLQVAATSVALLSFVMARRGRMAWWAVAAGATIMIALSLSLSGHAPAAPRWSALAVVLDAVHILAATGWLGSLVFVIAAGIVVARRLSADQRHAAVADLVNSFSPAALAFAALAGLTGVALAALHLQTLTALWSSDYGRTLLVKLALLSMVAGTGAYNWLRVRPTLGSEVATRRLARSATLELAVGAFVLAVTAVLVATATPAR